MGGAFTGSGASFGDGQQVWWASDFLQQRSCADVNVSMWTGSANMSLKDLVGDDSPTAQINIAPVFNGVALLGELGKVTAVSTHRFKSVVAAGGQMAVSLRGKAGEDVSLIFALVQASGVTCVGLDSTICADGTAVAHFAPGMLPASSPSTVV